MEIDMAKKRKKKAGKSKGTKKAPPKSFPTKDLSEAIAFVKEQNLTKVSHRSNGRKTWFHITDLPTDVRDGIQDFLTANPTMTIHQFGQYCIENALGIPLDGRIPGMEKIAKALGRKTVAKKGEFASRGS